MKGCVGTLDRVIRGGIGVVLLAVGLTHAGGISQGWAYVADLVGLIGLVTGLVGYCPLYILLGIQTCPAKKA